MADEPTSVFHQEGGETELSRDLSLFDITMIGVGAMIGAGIFVLTGLAAGQAGPALVMAFAFNGLITILTGMVYAELGSAIPEAGGGYLWVRAALGRSQAFLAGWMSWFAHAVAGSLYALAFASFTTLLLVEYFGVRLFGLDVMMMTKIFAAIAGALFAYINFRGAKETGLAGNIVTVVKVTIILIFAVVGLGVFLGQPTAGNIADFTPFLPRGYGGVFIAMGLTFIAFEGYEIIVQSGEEVINPRETIPKAVFYSMAIAVTIYMLVAIVLVGAVELTPELVAIARTGLAGGHGTGLGELPADPALWQVLGHLGEFGFARAAEQILPYGTLVILVAGMFATLSALNATTYSSTRVGFAMGRDHVLPDAMATVHPQKRTPHISVIFSAAIIIFMAVALPIAQVAVAADVMFLLLFLQVNYAAIVIRREHADELDYGYLMPWFPWVPIAGILTKLFLAVYLFNYSPLAWYGALGWIAVGFGIFLLYSRRRIRETEIERETRLVTEHRHPAARGYQVLVPIANPSHAERLVKIASGIARRHGGEVLLTSIVTVPEQTPLDVGRRYVGDQREVLEEAMRYVPEDVPAHRTVSIGRDVARTITHIAYQRSSDMIVLGWRGRRKHRIPELALGSIIDYVVGHAKTDVCVAKVEETERPSKILVPVAGGPHGDLAVAASQGFMEGNDARVTLLTVATDGPKEAQDRLEGYREDVFGSGERVETAVVEGRSIPDAIVDFAERAGFDTIIIGATEEGLLRRAIFGTVPEVIGERFDGQVLMFKKHRPVQSAFQNWIGGALERLKRVWPGR